MNIKEKIKERLDHVSNNSLRGDGKYAHGYEDAKDDEIEWLTDLLKQIEKHEN